MKLVFYQETRPGIPRSLREVLVNQAVESLRVKLKTPNSVGNAAKFTPLIHEAIIGHDETCLSAIIGIIYEVPDEETDSAFMDWAYQDFFDFLLPATWDPDYRGNTTVVGFLQDFQEPKRVPL